jgi:hypothetical protein
LDIQFALSDSIWNDQQLVSFTLVSQGENIRGVVRFMLAWLLQASDRMARVVLFVSWLGRGRKASCAILDIIGYVARLRLQIAGVWGMPASPAFEEGFAVGGHEIFDDEEDEG